MRPIAACDGCPKTRFEIGLTRAVFHALHVARPRAGQRSPLSTRVEALGPRDSLVAFPESTRGHEDEPLPSRSGLYLLAENVPEVPLVPAWIDQVQRVMPAGDAVPVPWIGPEKTNEPGPAATSSSRISLTAAIHP
jgi:1-acyl-sn-glycerol-3-phosphate acyltransferase